MTHPDKLATGIITICLNVFFWILKWVLYAFAAWLLFLAFHHHAHAQPGWWTARDVPGVGIWSNVGDTSGDIDFVIGSNSVPESYPSETNRLTQCRKKDATRSYWHSDQHYLTYYSFRVNNAVRRPSPSTGQAGVKMCEKRFGNDWLVLIVVEPWVVVQEECSGMTYRSEENVLVINRCIRLRDIYLPAPKYHLTWDIKTRTQFYEGDLAYAMGEGETLFTQICVDRIISKELNVGMIISLITAEEEDYSTETLPPIHLTIPSDSWRSLPYSIRAEQDTDYDDEVLSVRLTGEEKRISTYQLGNC